MFNAEEATFSSATVLSPWGLCFRLSSFENAVTVALPAFSTCIHLPMLRIK
jgi:hypothetical protein